MQSSETKSFNDANFNAELHARPSLYFSGPALVEHIALRASNSLSEHQGASTFSGGCDTHRVKTRVEIHTEFVTITRVTSLAEEPGEWPKPTLFSSDIADLLGMSSPTLVCQVRILVMGEPSNELGTILSNFGFADTVASLIGAGSGQVCSDFRVRSNGWSQILLFNKDLNAYRLGRMVRRIYEIETYRSMALLGLPQARRLTLRLAEFETALVELAGRNQSTPVAQHRKLLDEISELSAMVISASAETRSRFGATAAYGKIVEERIAELREAHVPGFQRYGVFVSRRFKPAIRTCEATALRLEQLSHATMHLLNLLQTRIQVEIEFQNSVQIQAMADRAATQVKIQRAVEGFSIIAISYYLVGLIKTAMEAGEHAGVHVDPLVMMGSIPIVIGTVIIAVLRVRHALSAHT
ncbi:DUF3422 family protein [Chelativorans sp. ZYF759]|uniref:DUF3422 domain-containing protein n=1 Tax=Chelativorans sp. ZYF759 TaxID=2692213 RepID=UPI00145E5B7F|nr:DUF3422 domain-containing protein [Chelativorans sp. ZYF759]NMG41452.1 DUF3422 family protein [Chelativorans sp. ZYF759]